MMCVAWRYPNRNLGIFFKAVFIILFRFSVLLRSHLIISVTVTQAGGHGKPTALKCNCRKKPIDIYSIDFQLDGSWSGSVIFKKSVVS